MKLEDAAQELWDRMDDKARRRLLTNMIREKLGPQVAVIVEREAAPLVAKRVNELLEKGWKQGYTQQSVDNIVSGNLNQLARAEVANAVHTYTTRAVREMTVRLVVELPKEEEDEQPVG